MSSTFIGPHTKLRLFALPYFMLKSSLFSGLGGWGREWVDNSGPRTYLDGSNVSTFRGKALAVNGVHEGSVGREQNLWTKES